MTRCLFLLLVTTKLFAASLEEADESFQKKQYQRALESYQTLLKDPSTEVRAKALFRTVESEALLFRYAAAVTRVYSASLPADPVWKVRFLLLRAEMARHFLTQYPTGSPPEAEVGNTDILRQTAEEWHRRIDAAFEALYRDHAIAQKRRLAEETYFIDSEKSDIAYVTLLDFLIARAVDYYLVFSPKTPYPKRPDGAAFFPPAFSLAGGAAAVRAARWLSLASSLRERFEAQRVLIPLRHPDRVRMGTAKDKSVAGALVVAAGRLRDRSAFAEVMSEAAGRLAAEENYPAALDHCRQVEEKANGTKGAEKCFQLRREILTPRLALRATPVAPRDSRGVQFTTRNLSQVHFRLYETTAEELRTLARKETFPGFHSLRHLSDVALDQYLTRTPTKSWTQPGRPAKPHAVSEGPLGSLPPLDEGVYVLVASSGAAFERKSDLIVGVPLNVTRLGLFATSGWEKKTPAVAPKRETKADGFQVYAIDTQTGEPVKAELNALLRRDWNKSVEEKKNTDADGRASFQASFARSGISWSLDVLARDKQSRGWLDRELPLQHQSRAAYDLYLETDRPIYRPGQNVKVRVTVLKRTEEGLEAFRGKEPIGVEIRDVNGESVGKQELPTNAYGSVALSFPVPTGRLLGAYSLQASLKIDDEDFQAIHSITVEEYKRPEMELTLNPGKGAWVLGQPVRVPGEAKYLFGKPVAGAALHYKVFREGFFPWERGGWLPVARERELIEEGDAKSGADGKFFVAFIPSDDEPRDNKAGDELPTRFSVEVEGHDAGGRTVTASQTYAAAKLPFQFLLEPQKAFWRPKTAPVVKVRALNPNGEGVPTSARYRLFQLAPKASDALTLEAQCEPLPDGKLVAEGAFDVGAKGNPLSLPALEEGIYRLRIASQKSERALLVPVVGDKTEVLIEAASLAERAEYAVGDTAQLFIGSSRLKGKIFVQIWSGEYLARALTLNGGAQRLAFPILPEHRPGLRVRWFGVYQNIWRTGEIPLSIRRDEKKLQLAWQAKAGYEPGEKVRWELKVKDAEGKPVDGEALVRVYDRALESYVAAVSEFRGELYEPRPYPLLQAGSAAPTDGTQLFIEPSRWNALLGLTPPRPATDTLPPPVLRSARSRYAHMGYGGGRMALKAAAPMAELQMADAAVSDRKGDGAPSAKAAPRSDFSETALFLPQLELRRGAGAASFLFPDSLTSWRSSVGVLTADGKWAFDSRVMTTSKDFMARLTLPRFWREGDRTEIVALLDNDMDKALQGRITLSVKIGDRNVEKDLGLGAAVKSFTVLPHGQTPVAWSVTIPSLLDEVKIEVTADAGNYRDAETRALPILPARERIVDSKFVAIENGKSVKLAPPALQPTDSLDESVLQIDPQLFSSLLASLPHLVESTAKSTDAVLYRWLPLALVQSLYTSQPELKRLAERLPKRTTPLPAWEEKDSRRQTQLDETPWRAISRGGPEDLSTADLLDARLVVKREVATLAQLRAYQLPSGAFPWFPGGEPDFFITLSVLGAMAEARDLGVTVPEELARKAFEYAVPKLAERLQPKQTGVALALYASYVLSSYLESDWAKAAKETIVKTLAVAESQVDALTPIGKAYAAWAWRRLGDAPKADALLNQALDGAREDAIVGTYWQPEPMSWLWYHDSLDKHAFFLRTLLKWRPQDPKIPGLMRWLLFHRKGNSWESPRAAIGATFALAQGLSVGGSLKGYTGKFRVDWPPVKETRDISIDTVLEKPWRWSKSGEVPVAEINYQGSAPAFASLTTVFSSATPPAPPKEALLQLDRKLFRKTPKGWLPLRDGDRVRVGDAVQVQCVIKSRSQFEYVHLRSPRGAGFESDEKLSGYRWEKLAYYQEPRDSRENFFLPWIPQGEFRLVTQWHAVSVGEFRIAPALLQSIYAPELAAYAPGLRVIVEK